MQRMSNTEEVVNLAHQNIQEIYKVMLELPSLILSCIKLYNNILANIILSSYVDPADDQA